MYFLSLVGISRAIAVELQPALVEAVHVLDERDLQVQAGILDEAAHGLAELGEDRLLRLRDGVDGREEQEHAGPRRRR